MIHEIGVELQARLTTQVCPVTVVDGPELGNSNAVTRERIVIERDRGEAEPVAGPKGTGRNPRHAFDRVLAAKVTIYAQEPRPGALYFEHERRCDHIADLVLVALEKVLISRKDGGFSIGAGRWVDIEDLAKSKRPSMVAYEIPFTVRRAVEDRTWAGVAATEATLTGSSGGVTIRNTTEVSAQGDSTPAEEVACGA